VLYVFLYNKWYFDELYDFTFVRSAKASAASCGRRATG
jgi:NADH-quinone oxidoreductase subunit L